MSSINLGPFNVNKPTPDEKESIRQSLGLYSGALIDATFNDTGSVLTFTDPSSPTKIIELDKERLTSTIADRLATSQTFTIIGDVATTVGKTFNGTGPVELPVAIAVGAVTATKLADNAVIGSKIADSSISPSKLSSGGPIWTTDTFSTGANSSSFGVSKSGAVAIKLGSGRSGPGVSSIEFTSVAGTSSNSSLSRASGSDGDFDITNTGSGTFKITQTGSAPIVFGTNSIERVRIDNSGRMTIEAPSLEQATLYLKTSSIGTAGSPALFVDPPAGVTSKRAAAVFGDWQIGQDSLVTGVKDFYVYQAGTSNAFRVNISASGNVGIGVDNAAVPLQVYGQGRFGSKGTETGGTIALYNDGNDATIEAFAGNNNATKRNIMLARYGGNVGVGKSPTTALDVNGTVTATQFSGPLLVSGTAVALTNQTNVDFTGIPSWVKRITVVFDGTKSNSTAQHLIQLGTSNGIVSSGYTSYTIWSQTSGGNGSTSSTAGFIHWNANPNDVKYATMTLINISGNTWVSSHNGAFNNATTYTYGVNGGGRIGLSEKLTTIRFTTVGGAGVFTSGNINIIYE